MNGQEKKGSGLFKIWTLYPSYTTSYIKTLPNLSLCCNYINVLFGKCFHQKIGGITYMMEKNKIKPNQGSNLLPVVGPCKGVGGMPFNGGIEIYGPATRYNRQSTTLSILPQSGML